MPQEKKKQNKNNGRQIRTIFMKMCLHDSHAYKTQFRMQTPQREGAEVKIH